MIRQDKYRVGDIVKFRNDLEEYNKDLIGRETFTKTLTVNKVFDRKSGFRSMGHTQHLNCDNGESYSGWWFQPLR